MKTTRQLSILAAVGLCLLMTPSASQAVVLDWTSVGDAGNADDTTGYGGVGYNYAISTYEVTNAQYVEFLNAKAASDPNGLFNTTSDTRYHITRSGTDGSYTYTADSGWENNPVNYVSFFDAMRFVNWLENGQGSGDTESGTYTIGTGLDETRAGGATYWLPSEDEWYKAAYYTGSGYTLYPTGNSVPGVEIDANYGGSGGTYADTWTRGTGTAENYGTYDMGGNVWEWNEAVLLGSYRGVRGGSWTNNEFVLQSSIRGSNGPSGESFDTAFRVASSFFSDAAVAPEPSTVLLMVVGGGVLRAAYRRRRR